MPAPMASLEAAWSSSGAENCPSSIKGWDEQRWLRMYYRFPPFFRSRIVIRQLPHSLRRLHQRPAVFGAWVGARAQNQDEVGEGRRMGEDIVMGVGKVRDFAVDEVQVGHLRQGLAGARAEVA